ncbi:MAG: hypothetical protein WC557_08165 [Ignavibacteriaceae bacterium]
MVYATQRNPDKSGYHFSPSRFIGMIFSLSVVVYGNADYVTTSFNLHL